MKIVNANGFHLWHERLLPEDKQRLTAQPWNFYKVWGLRAENESPVYVGIFPGKTEERAVFFAVEVLTLDRQLTYGSYLVELVTEPITEKTRYVAHEFLDY